MMRSSHLWSSSRSLTSLALGIAALPWSLAAQSRTRDAFAGFDSVATAAMTTWKVPGMAIAVVRRDSVIFAKGYGVRRLGEATPVDPNTLFAIGSASKAFTGAALAMLADDGKVTMDDRVIDHLAYFRMYDPWVTRELRLRDLLLHRSGMERGELVWYSTTRSREENVRAIKDLAPTTSFRSKFQYQNLMYITAGEVIRAVSGQSWDDFVKARIFTPLGMRASNTSVRDLAGQPNVATPHAEIDGAVHPVPWRNIDNAGAAGSINSSVLDVSRWLRFWLGKGTFEGKRVLSEAMVAEAIRPQMLMDDPILTMMIGGPSFPTYAFGWFVQDFRGRRYVVHGGNIDGMSAMVGFLPDDGIGVVILSNMNQTNFTIPLLMHVYDRALGIAPPDYLGDYRRKEQQFMAALQQPQPTPVTGTRPALSLDAYAGTYRHTLYGTATVRHEAGALTISYDHNPNGVGDLAHTQYETFTATMRDPILGKVPVTFRIGSSGRVESMHFPLMGSSGEWMREARS